MEVTEKETTLNESHRLEVEITTVLLGFVFVTYSIVLTAQSDVLSLMNQVGFRLPIDNSVIWLRAVDVLSESGLYCSFSLLGAILFYLLFLRFKKEAMLLTARSLLAIGLFLSIVLLLLINALYSIRLVGATQVNVAISPFGSLVLNLSGIVAAIYILVIWVMWLHKNIRVRLKNAKPVIHEVVIMTGKEQPRNEPDDIFDLVEWIDGKQAELFQGYDGLKGKMAMGVVLLLSFFFAVGVIVDGYALVSIITGNFGLDVEIIVISTMLSAFSAVIAGLSLFSPFFEQNTVEVRFKRAIDSRKRDVELHGKKLKLKEFTGDEKPLLKALIEIRSKNDGFTLRQLYDLDKTKAVFSKEKLLERLCK